MEFNPQVQIVLDEEKLKSYNFVFIFLKEKTIKPKSSRIMKL